MTVFGSRADVEYNPDLDRSLARNPLSGFYPSSGLGGGVVARHNRYIRPEVPPHASSTPGPPSRTSPSRHAGPPSFSSCPTMLWANAGAQITTNPIPMLKTRIISAFATLPSVCSQLNTGGTVQESRLTNTRLPGGRMRATL